MEDAFVRIFGFALGIFAIAFGIFAYNNENKNPRHANCGVFWKIITPGVVFTLGISLVIFVIVWI